MPEPVDAPDWWMVDGDTLRSALEAAASGEPVDLILLGLYANSDLAVDIGDE